MLVWFFLQKLLIFFFICTFKEKLILPVEKFSLKGEMMRNLQATGKHLLECKQLVQIYCRRPLSTLPLAAGHTERFALEKSE